MFLTVVFVPIDKCIFFKLLTYFSKIQKLVKVEPPEITRVHSGADSPQTKVSNECEVGGTQFSPSPTPRPVNQIPKDTWPDPEEVESCQY